ncbi:MAG: nitrate reductase [Betaproteobacteria bacterium]|nr:nitrate reductase [Betaproteobacteria bacterium]
MTLLEFARGPGLWASIIILVAGTLWRIAAIYRFKVKPDLSEPRGGSTVAGALNTIIARMLPRNEFGYTATLTSVNGYIYHIGLAIVVFLYLPHMFFIDRLTGLSWPVPPVWVFYAAVALTFVSMLIAIIYRITDPVRSMLSGFDDYFSWAVVFLPLLTGMAALGNPLPKSPVPETPLYPGPLTVHLLSVELLLIWLPFGKLAHTFLVFFSRGMTGAAFARRGART